MVLVQKFSVVLLLRLAFQSLGVVFGDLGTSPLYVFYNTFSNEIKDPEDVIGALSLIIYSLTLIPLLKYVVVVCKANDNGQGTHRIVLSYTFRHTHTCMAYTTSYFVYDVQVERWLFTRCSVGMPKSKSFRTNTEPMKSSRRTVVLPFPNSHTLQKPRDGLKAMLLARLHFFFLCLLALVWSSGMAFSLLLYLVPLCKYI